MHGHRLFCGIAFLLTIAAPAWAEATKPIRVLIYQDVPHVEVSASRELTVHVPGGEVGHVASRLLVKPLDRALEVNGERLSTDRVVVRGRHEDIQVTAPEPVQQEEDKRSVQRRAVFLRLEPSSRPAGVAGQKPPDPAGPEPFVVGGEIEILSRGNALWVVNRLSLEEYVMGVVPAEMSAQWHPEALKVQAVATRTYALYQMMIHADREYDVVATIHDQVYRGRAGVVDRVREAVESTAGLALTHEERPILAVFSSTAAGPTEDAANVWAKNLPYLKGVECPFDRESPYYEWRTVFPLTFLEAGLRREGWEVGTIATLTPYAYSKAGRVSRLRILHSGGELLMRGEDLRRIVGYRVIPSTRFTIDAIGSDIELSGYGAGHAVGLCQWGAKELAELGYPSDAILRYYFPGTELRRTYRLDPLPTSPP